MIPKVAQEEDDIPLFYSDVMPLLVRILQFLLIQITTCLFNSPLVSASSSDSLVLCWQINDEPSVGEDAFVWLAALVPFAADVVNGRFTFETLTAPTGNRLFFPAYDKFLKEISK